MKYDTNAPTQLLLVCVTVMQGRAGEHQPKSHNSSCSPCLPPLSSPHPGPKHSLPLCVMQGEHQLGRRNSWPCRGRLLLHTTPSLCHLFFNSYHLYLDLYLYLSSICICTCFSICICVCICNSGPASATHDPEFMSPVLLFCSIRVLSSRFRISCSALLKLQIKFDPWRSDL